MPKLQPSFRKGHLIETLLRLVANIYAAVDAGRTTLLALLDESATFDTFDHNIFLIRFGTSYGFTGGSLEWIASSLTGRRWDMSAWNRIVHVLPQGSVLGPPSVSCTPRTWTRWSQSLVHGFITSPTACKITRPASHLTPSIAFWGFLRQLLAFKPGWPPVDFG